MKIYILILVAAVFSMNEAMAKSNVIEFKIPPSRRTCAKQLAAPATVVPYPSRLPQYQSSNEFLADMHHAGNDKVYFFHNAGGEHHPFELTYARTWSQTPPTPNGEDLYIVSARPQRADSQLDKSSFSLFTARTHYNLDSFTKVRVAPIFALIAKIIRNTRQLEEQATGIDLQAPQLDFSVLYARDTMAVRVENVLNSWVTVSPYEEKVREVMKEHLRLNPLTRGTQEECRKFAQSLLPELEKIYRNTAFLTETLLSAIYEAL